MILKVTLSKTTGDRGDYMQIMSDDMLSVNIVLVADKIEVNDARQTKKEASRGGRIGR